MSPTPSTEVRACRTCQAMTRAGNKCRNGAVQGSKFCYFHNPKLAQKRRQAQRKGGIHALIKKIPPLPADTPDVDLKSAEDVRLLISDTISRLRRGEMDRQICYTVGYLSQICLKSIEQGELEDRIKAIEDELLQEK